MPLELVKDLERQGNEFFAANPPNNYYSAQMTAKCMFAFIYAYEEHLPAMNLAKGKLDEAYKTNNIEDFTKALWDFKCSARKITDLKAAFKSKCKYLLKMRKTL